MTSEVELCIPDFPDCWETCGSCGSGDVQVAEVLVAAGDVVERDAPVIVLDTGKTTLDIPASRGGRVVRVLLQPGDPVEQGAAILILEAAED